MCRLHDGCGAIRAIFSDREINVASKIVDELTEIITAQKRKLNAKNKLLRERAAEIQSLEKQLTRESRKLKKQTELAADPSKQIDKFKAKNKELRKELAVLSAKIKEPQTALAQAIDKIKQLQEALDDQTRTAARRNQTISELNKRVAPPPHEPPSETPTKRMVAAGESGQMGTHPIQGGPAGSLGHRSRRAKHR